MSRRARKYERAALELVVRPAQVFVEVLHAHVGPVLRVEAARMTGLPQVDVAAGPVRSQTGALQSKGRSARPAVLSAVFGR